MIILNEKSYAKKCLESGIIGDKPLFTLSVLAKYYYWCFGYSKNKIISLLFDFLSKYYPKYELNKSNWQAIIEEIAKKASSIRLFEISGIKVTKAEMKTIFGLKNKVLERLAFTMLCIAKLNNIKNPKNNGWVNADSKDIFNYARISCRSDEREIKMGQLWRKGLLEFSKRNDNLNCRVTFINDDSEEVLFVSDFRELGYEYLLYKGENFIRCESCGILTRGNKARTKKHCNCCDKYKPKGYKTVVCVDCGKGFKVNAKDNQTCRCKDCYIKYRKEYKAKNERERRIKMKENL